MLKTPLNDCIEKGNYRTYPSFEQAWRYNEKHKHKVTHLHKTHIYWAIEMKKQVYSALKHRDYLNMNTQNVGDFKENLSKTQTQNTMWIVVNSEDRWVVKWTFDFLKPNIPTLFLRGQASLSTGAEWLFCWSAPPDCTFLCIRKFVQLKWSKTRFQRYSVRSIERG